jgi:hypothetical protein
MELVKSFLNHKGVDLKSSDLLRPKEYATDMRNAQYGQGGAIEKRKGFQGAAPSAGGYGLFTYRRYNPVSGVAVPELLTIDENLWKMNESTITVAYSGTDDTCALSLFLDEDSLTYKMQILEGTVLVLDQDLGVGYDEGSTVTLADLKTAVDAVTNFTATITGVTTAAAAFLPIVREFDLNAESFSATSRTWSQVNTTVSDPLANYYAQRNEDDFENVSSVQLQNVIYFGTGYDEVMKYDGQTFYRAGLPTASALTASLSAGAITGSNYVHKAQYAQYDAAGQIIEGNLTTSVAQNAAAQRFTLTLENVQQASGFNTNCAIVAGAQAAVNTITVDDGSGGTHSLQVGDTAYFYDGVSASYVTREVTARAATTITVAGAAVTVADNAVISNNLRILIWRSKNSAVTPTLFYFVDEIPNNSYAATQSYVDNTVDASLGELLLPPTLDRSAPPKGKYVSQWNGQMFVAGIIESPTTLAWSDVDGPEYFPNNTNQIFVEPGNGDTITGIAPNNEVFTVHGDTSFTVISGDIGTGQIRVETRARDAGCSAHASIQDIDGVLVWLSPQGPRQSAGGQIPVPLGPALDPSESNQASRIDPIFDNAGKAEPEKLRMKRAVAFNDTGSDQYVLFVPCITNDAGTLYPNVYSLTFVYERVRDAWLIWNNWNASSGMTELNGDIFLHGRYLSDFVDDIQAVLFRRHSLNDAFDYADSTNPVNFDYAPQWEFLGEPSVLKDPVALKVYSLESVPNNLFELTVEQEVNFQNDSSAANFTMDISGGGYGFSSYGLDLYSDPLQDSYNHPLGRTRQRSIRTRFKNEVLHQAVSLTGWEIEFSVPYRPEFKP